MPEFHKGSSDNMKLATIAFALALVIAPLAWAGEALVDSEVEVDSVGKDAADARAQAMAKANVDALTDLLNKLSTPDQAQVIVSGLDAAKITGMVRGTEVLDEKISSNRYRAHLKVTFDGDEISNLIGKVGAAAPGGEVQQVGSFLIIPGYQEEDNVMLWEDDNPWRIVWKATGLEMPAGDIIVPYGDNQDVAVVDATNVESANYASLAPLMIRYGVSDVVIAQAKFVRSPDMTLTVVKRHISRTENEVNLLTYRADPQETKDMLLARAARDIAENAQHKKSEEAETIKNVHGGERNSVMVLASITTMASWTQLRSKLTGLPMVDKLELLAMSPQQVDMIVHYRGTPESLANAITAQNVRLVKNPNYWVISRD